MIGCVETLAYARYRRNDAFMAPTERKMAVDGMTASVKILPADVVAQISALSAPVMAAFGFALYFMRLAELEQRLRADKRDNDLSANAGDILANQPYYPSAAPADPVVADNGFIVPPKSVIQNLQEGT